MKKKSVMTSRAVQLYESGVSVRVIAGEMGVSAASVYNWIKVAEARADC